MTGKTLGHYRIEEKLGAGGMGVVYRARDLKLERDVALKLLPEQLSAQQGTRAQLLNEARAASALNHAHIATVYEVGEAEGRSYIAMEYVEGHPLSQQIPPEGLPIDTVLRYGAQMAAALAHAHDRGVVHRDLKSANVVITPEGQAKVLDFGLASRGDRGELDKATRSLDVLDSAGKIAGTLHYMAPEVLRGEPADARGDLWALGVVFYEMAAGKLPFEGRTGFELTSAILRESPATLPPRVPAGLRAVIQRCLAKEPGQRYHNAGEARAALEAISSDTAVTAPVAAAVLAAPRPWWRRKLVWWSAAAAAFVALAFWKGPFVISVGDTPLPPSGPRLSTGSPASPNQEANEYYEKAVVILRTQADRRRAQQMFERALQLDPRFAEARAYYGLTYVLLVRDGYSNDPAMIYKAEQEMRLALEHDANSSRARAVLGAAYLLLGRKELAREELAKAAKADPDNVTRAVWQSQYHHLNGEYAVVNALCRETLERQPTLLVSRVLWSDSLRESGRIAEAQVQAEKVLEQGATWPDAFRLLARIHIDAGDFPKARAALEAASPLESQNYLIRLTRALLLASENRRAEARSMMDSETRKFAETNVFFTVDAADFYALMGDTNEALDWLDRAVRNGDERLEWFQRDPLLASIRQHPRFKQILDSIAFRRQQRAR